MTITKEQLDAWIEREGENILSYHACNWGDCAHTRRTHCNKALVVELAKEKLAPLLLQAVVSAKNISPHSETCGWEPECNCRNQALHKVVNQIEATVLNTVKGKE